MVKPSSTPCANSAGVESAWTDLESTFKRVADELHHQYLLGFTPAKLDGKVHKLEVRTDNAGATVRARQTYVATPDR